MQSGVLLSKTFFLCEQFNFIYWWSRQFGFAHYSWL